MTCGSGKHLPMKIMAVYIKRANTLIIALYSLYKLFVSTQQSTCITELLFAREEVRTKVNLNCFPSFPSKTHRLTILPWWTKRSVCCPVYIVIIHNIWFAQPACEEVLNYVYSYSPVFFPV